MPNVSLNIVDPDTGHMRTVVDAIQDASVGDLLAKARAAEDAGRGPLRIVLIVPRQHNTPHIIARWANQQVIDSIEHMITGIPVNV
ncbi:hypothetical protein [Actinomadura sp. NPDC048394]|uniref:hypothetical protein n=1 Tax=Actinomadura sp. NPDC048394 TaxID=3158223 RepID=UPI0033FAB036